jgi:hypothetical protein
MTSINNPDFEQQNYLEAFYTFIENTEGSFIDFEIENNSDKIADLLSVDVEPYFIPIGKQGSDSLICYWKYKDEIPVSELPIVWLDSEGSPNSVAAANFKDFLSLLPYDTGAIYDFISSWEYYNSDPDYYPSPLDRYKKDSSDLNSLIEECRESYSQYDSFVNWLEQSLNISICEDPAKLVGDAIQNFPNLQNWLEERGIG